MRHSLKQPWITHKVLFFQPSSCWELTYGPCSFLSRELSFVKCFSWTENSVIFLRTLLFHLQSQDFSVHSRWEVRYECFSLKRSGDPYSSLSEWLPDYGWCYFLHVAGEPCSVRHLPSNQGLRHLRLSKSTEMSNERWPQTATPCEVWCFSCFWWPAPDAFRHEQLSVGNPLRHQAPPLTEVRNQGPILTSLWQAKHEISSFPEVKQEISAILRPHQDTKVSL